MEIEEKTLTDDFFRFPHTPHLAWLGADKPRDDKVLSIADANALLTNAVVLEEKLDGANLGISLDQSGQLRMQNRGEYLSRPLRGQFSRATAWLAEHQAALTPALGSHLMLFGEWCAARHSIVYNQLPDWFLAFDVYDREARRFWSTARRDDLVATLGLSVVPHLARNRTTLGELRALVMASASQCGAPHLEGVVIRLDGPKFLDHRAKLVHPNFTQAIGEHWRSRKIEWNVVDHSQ